ncbi:MAG: UTP--glucose-1-phosphate uridylyltransferase GalU [Desulfobacterales bacterium]|nr:UTP--glucose-1-phosphate uridylyltransferase GalU [Desulfobacterales bacterium]
MKVRKAVFPVAGLGTRFLPATKAMPKEMLPVVDKPLIQYVVEEALSSGIEQIIFVTGRGKTALEDHFDRSRELEKNLSKRGKEELLDTVKSLVPSTGTIIYTRQNEPLGLGHAIWCARDVVGNEPFAVLLADDLIQTDGKPVIGQMIDKFEKYQSSILAIEEVDPQQTDKYGILNVDKVGKDIIRIKGMVEKPSPELAPSNLAIIGRYILTPEIFGYLGQGNVGAGGEIQLTDAMAQLLKEQPFYGYRFEGKRFDCGDKAGFQMANIAFSLDRPDLKSQLVPFLKSICKCNDF